MVIDSSALIAILFEEADASVYLYAIANDPVRLVSASTLLETSVVLIRRRSGDPIGALEVLMTRFGIEVVPFNGAQVVIARDAFRRFGKGRHLAGLNFGDCFSYALSKQTGEPLLFKGNDFGLTDVAVV